jgi:hypothetical protein
LDFLYVILWLQNKTKEVTIMKAATIHRTRKSISHPYPNAAERRYYLQKLLDGVLALAIVVGGLTAMVFLIFL